MSQPLVIRTDVDGITSLIFNRPEKLNTLGHAVFNELRQHIIDIQDDAGVRCVILRGAGKCFSAGHDLSEVAELADQQASEPGWESQTLRMLERMSKPVIAAVHGHCYTGALEVALAADFIVVADNARLADTHAKWALTPIWGMSQRLPRRVGLATAKRLMFTSTIIDANEALRIGLCEAVYPLDRFDEEIEKLAHTILENSAFSQAAYKRLLEATDGDSLDKGLQWEVYETEGTGPDVQARIDAFARKSK
ncbi:Crotonyl-CoA hydratase [Zhongshania aliphaticivorans]|uniref:Crotonyl-CoA hydratase n=1 Tax=Zhongshania aliphaticivorans TaxID=1470434 RepID=A0A5S9MXE3_9GAMM|nr:enoyl-CoA hydratase/isomerase family protein [Zhongshania aliphaticivorans]CAA0081829.1 Crotonyl-CoA hydratase [Zhongshania aliphaticivorans]CAA0084637.1 Crotonyl-CoA hydratase [Zhongshania aliphaticivorans]